VHTEHEPCEHERDKQSRRPSIKGYVLNRQPDGIRRYRHNYFTAQQCRGHTWLRSELEHPIIEQVRRLAQDPRLVEQLVLAERHDSAATSFRLTDADIGEIKRELEQIERTLEAMSDQFVLDLEHHQQPVEVFQRLISGTQKRRSSLERRLAAEEDRRSREESGGAEAGVHQDRLSAFLSIMTPDPPEDPYLKCLRARLFQCCVSTVRIGHDEDGSQWIEIHGPLVPDDGLAPPTMNPVLQCANLLDQHLHRAGSAKDVADMAADLVADSATETVAGAGSEGEGEGEEGCAQTDLSRNRSKSVCAQETISYLAALPPDDYMGMPSNEELHRRAEATLSATGWHKRSGSPPVGWVPSWRLSFKPVGAGLGKWVEPISTLERSKGSIRRAQGAFQEDDRLGTGSVSPEPGSTSPEAGWISPEAGPIGWEAYGQLRKARPDLDLVSSSYVRRVLLAVGYPSCWKHMVRAVCEEVPRELR